MKTTIAVCQYDSSSIFFNSITDTLNLLCDQSTFFTSTVELLNLNLRESIVQVAKTYRYALEPIAALFLLDCTVNSHIWQL